MLVDKTVKIEQEPSDILTEVGVVIGKVKAGEALPSVLLGEAVKLFVCAKEAMSLPADAEESANGTLRAVALGLVDIGCVLLGVKVEA
jgi:hypothetical protein